MLSNAAGKRGWPGAANLFGLRIIVWRTLKIKRKKTFSAKQAHDQGDRQAEKIEQSTVDAKEQLREQAESEEGREKGREASSV